MNESRVSTGLAVAVIGMALAAFAGCGDGGSSAPPAAAPPAAGGGGEGGAAAAPVAAGGGGKAFPAAEATATITVKCRLDGAAPKNRPITLNADCAALHTEKVFEEAFVVGEGGALANAIAHVATGADRWTHAAPSAPVMLDQKGCVYLPHVFTIMTGQTLEVHTSDPVMHNIHIKPNPKGKNAEDNKPQLPKAPSLKFTFKAPETAVKIACDVHAWMETWAGVFSHPFHGVTGADGTVALPNLPPGDYEIGAWHEKLGAATPVKVTVAANEKKTVEVVFKAK